MTAVPIPLHRPSEAELVAEACVESIDAAREALRQMPDSRERHLVEVELDRILGFLASGPPDE